jgi:hypothetical protein
MNDPRQILMQFLGGRMNPTVNKLMNMSYPELEKFAINYCKECGVDFNKELDKLKQRFS